MEVRLAKSAGFCFGVNKAMEKVYEQIDKANGTKIYTYGPIIHNEEVVKDFAAYGEKAYEYVIGNPRKIADRITGNKNDRNNFSRRRVAGTNTCANKSVARRQYFKQYGECIRELK